VRSRPRSGRGLAPALAALVALAAPVALGGPFAAAAGAQGVVVANGSFEEEDGRLPRAWSRGIGAQVLGVDPVESECRLDDAVARSGKRSLLLAGSSGTTVWTVVEQRIGGLAPGARLLVTGWVRTDAVGPEGKQSFNCNLLVYFTDAKGGRVAADGARLLATEQLRGSNDWRRVGRSFIVPEGATAATVGCFLSCTGKAWFDDVTLSSWISKKGRGYEFHHLEGDSLPAEAMDFNERALEGFARLFGVAPKGPIQYYKYPDNETKGALTGRPGNAHAVPERLEVHTIHARDNHEVVHVLMHAVNPEPNVLLGEGLAVGISGKWQGAPLDEYVRKMRAEGRYVPLREIAEGKAFRALDDHVTYPESGGFAKYLLETFGVEAVKKVYAETRAGDSADEVEARFKGSIGEPLSKLEERWLRKLEAEK